MTQDEIIRMAREADFYKLPVDERLERFAALVRADLMKQVIDTCEDEMVEQDEAGNEESCALIRLMRKLEKLK